MQIVIELDMEAIVREEVRTFIRENLVIQDVKKTVRAAADSERVKAPDSFSHVMPVMNAADLTATPAEETPAEKVEETTEKGSFTPEFAPKIGKRRSKPEMAMHDKEMELGRNLTPEEKGEITADIEMEDEREAKAKADRRQKKAAEKTVAEVTAEIEAEQSDSPTEEATSSFMKDITGAKTQSVTDLFQDVENAPEEASEDTAQQPVDEVAATEEQEADQPPSETDVPKTAELDTLNSLFS